MDERKDLSVSWFHGSGHHSGGHSRAAQLTFHGLETVEESDDVGISPLFIPFSSTWVNRIWGRKRKFFLYCI